MTTIEKIQEKKKKISAAEEKILKEQEKISKLKKEIATLEGLEVKALLKEIDLPIDQVRNLLKTMKPTPTVDPEEKNKC